MPDERAAAFDVLVVGGGPAGCLAGLALAERWSVGVIERTAEARQRIGETLVPAARRILTETGLWESFTREAHTPHHVRRSYWGGASHELDLLRDPDGHGWHLDRARFEGWLRREARARGVHWLTGHVHTLQRHHDGWHVNLRGSSVDMPLRARILIDAGGRGSPVARRLGVERRADDRLMCRWWRGLCARTADAGGTFVEADADGWWYTSPLPDGERIVAYHTDRDLPSARVPPAFPRHLLALLHASDFTTRASGACAAHSAYSTTVGSYDWLAVGDAAMTLDPLASQGLFNALYTGLVGARCVDSMLQLGKYANDAPPDVLHEYGHSLECIYRRFQAQLRYTYQLGAPTVTSSLFWHRRAA